MKYTKPALSFEQQAHLLIERGLLVEKEQTLYQTLRRVNYYRLSAYWYPFKRIDPSTGQETFVPGTQLQTILQFYSFDRELRLLIMDAIEHIEVAIFRTRLVEKFSLKYGPFGYFKRSNFRPGFSKENYDRLFFEIGEAVRKSKEEFITRFKAKYTQEPLPPFWMIAEILSFGQLFTLYNNFNREDQIDLAKEFGVTAKVFTSWLLTLNFVRNSCAHHARLWNRQLPVRPGIPDYKNDPDWYHPHRMDNRKIFATLTIIWYILKRIDPSSRWREKLIKLLSQFQQIPINLMGFPSNWLELPIWQEQKQ